MEKGRIVFRNLIEEKQIFNRRENRDCLNRPYETDADVSEIYPFATYKIREINVKKVTPRGEAEPIFPT